VGRGFRLFLIFGLALASSAGPRPAQAATTEADDLVNRAVELRRSGDDEGALSLLLRAYALDHPPRATGQLGLCEQALGRWADAEAYLTEALKAEKDPWVEKNRPTLEDSLAFVKSHVARIEIEGEPVGAEVWVNGSLVGKLPLAAPVHVAAGEEVEVELRSPGFLRETKTLRLEAGQYQPIVLRASKIPSPPVLALSPLAASTAQASTTTLAAQASQIQKPSRTILAWTPGRRRALKWVGWGLGAAAIGVGIYGTIGNVTGVNTFDKTCRTSGNAGVVASTGAESAACDDLKGAYESKTDLAVGGFVAAGAFVAAGLTLWLTEPPARRSDVPTVVCAPAMSDRLDLALRCLMRF
jgi:hypothetical protein